MKIAISGKGGVGKTTLAALLAKEAVAQGDKVLAVDADPDANLASTLGIDAQGITPLIELRELIEERAGTGGLIKLNPKVDDIPDNYSVYKDGIKLMVMGTIRKGGAGCACPENSFLRSLLQHVLFDRDELVIVDMEAGIEHLGRATAKGVDAMIVVVDPDRRSLETAERIIKLAKDIDLKRVFIIGNGVRDASDKDYIQHNLPAGTPLIGFISYNDRIRISGKEGGLPEDGPIYEEIKNILEGIAEKAPAL